MSDLSERLLTLKKVMKIKKEEIARQLGVSRTMLYNYENDDPAPPSELLKTLGQLEKIHGIERAFISVGHSVQRNRANEAIRRIPVVGWAHAGDAHPYDEQPCDADDYIPTDCPDDRAIGVKIEGESMEPKFSEGDLLILQPGKPAYNGCLAVCRFKNDGVVFRRVEFLPDRVRLIALNPAWPTTDHPRSDFQWIYPVWGRWSQIWK